MIDIYQTTFSRKENQHYQILRQIFVDYYNFTFDAIEKDSYGKPYIDDCTYHFSISHHKNQLMIAVSDNSIGVDIEPSNREVPKNVIDKVSKTHYVCDKYTHLDIWLIKESQVNYF